MRGLFHLKSAAVHLCCFGALICSHGQAIRAEDHSAKLDEFLSAGELQQSAEHFLALKNDNQAQLALGITQFLQGVERLGQDGYRYGLRNQFGVMVPIARMPVPANKSPELLTYESLREVLERFQKQLSIAESTLSQVDTKDVKLSFYIGKVKLDLDGNKVFTENESLWQIFAAINNGIDGEITEAQSEAFSVGVDGADVHWLRGYCHVLMGMCDIALAYDQKELFERCGHLWFPNTQSPYQLAYGEKNDQDEPEMVTTIADLIAAIHLFQFELREPSRMQDAHGHLTEMIRQSRLSWERAMAETDNDREWIPNPEQESVIQVRVERDMITSWHSVLDELEAIMEGKKLAPNWRRYLFRFTGVSSADTPSEGQGINVKKFFYEPRRFDLILTLQGSDLLPYLEDGPLSTPEAWERMTSVFRGQFFGFAIWFN